MNVIILCKRQCIAVGVPAPAAEGDDVGRCRELSTGDGESGGTGSQHDQPDQQERRLLRHPGQRYRHVRSCKSSGLASSFAFRHLPPHSARFGYASQRALFISAQLSRGTLYLRTAVKGHSLSPCSCQRALFIFAFRHLPPHSARTGYASERAQL